VANWIVTFLVRGEEATRFANGRAATVFGPGVTDKVTNDGTEVSIPTSGGQLGQAIDKIRVAIAKETQTKPENPVLIGARRLPRWEITPRTASIIFTASGKSVRSNVHCVDTQTGAIGFLGHGDSNHYLASPPGSGAPREYDPEEMKNVQTINRPCYAIDEANETPPPPVGGVADVSAKDSLITSCCAGPSGPSATSRSPLCKAVTTTGSGSALDATIFTKSSVRKPDPYLSVAALMSYDRQLS
jgi:hypothetical protein